MATITFTGLKLYEQEMALFRKNLRKICGAMTYAGANIVADEIKAGIERLPADTGVTRQGLIEGFGIAGLRNDDGVYNVKLGFDGYNANGVPNALMARVFEKGTSTVSRRPFVAPAVRRSRKRAEAEMAAILEREMKEMFE